MEKYDTLNYYNENAQTYCEQTRNGNMQELYDKFLSLVKKNGYILDFGCGSGRDSKYFIEHGYKVMAIDGSIEMCKLAEDYIHQEVKCMKFDELDEKELFDGIWACSSILHVERKDLINVLRKMVNALKSVGVIYTCFKNGDSEKVEDGKYYNYINKEIFERMLNEASQEVTIVDYFESITKPNINRPQANWGNYLILKKKN